MQGSLFDLPAGTVKTALGAGYRKMDYEFINDTITNQGESFRDQALGIYPSSDSFGSYNVKEVYGELLVPVLKDIPAIKSFSLELGARHSQYNTTGGSWTYKILGDWEVTDWLRPARRLQPGGALAEHRRALPGQFPDLRLSSLGDLCSERSTYRVSANAAAGGNTPGNAADVKAVCSIVMDRTGGAGTGAGYYSRPASGQPGAWRRLCLDQCDRQPQPEA